MARGGLLAGRKALVTGAGGGIGRAIALALAREGAGVAVTDLDAQAAQRVAAEIGHEAVARGSTSPARPRSSACWPRRVTDLGGLDTVCANAGVSTMAAVVDLTEEEWDHNMAVNAKGMFLTDRAAVRLWQAEGTEGVIVNTASLAAKKGAPLLAHYSASKFAVLGFTQALAREVARSASG